MLSLQRQYLDAEKKAHKKESQSVSCKDFQNLLKDGKFSLYSARLFDCQLHNCELVLGIAPPLVQFQRAKWVNVRRKPEAIFAFC